MRSQDRHCTFICAEDSRSGHDIDDTCDPRVYLCFRIPQSTLEESALLQGLASTAGLAYLPSRVSSDDARLWFNSSLTSVPDSAYDLAQILKVADALGDARFEPWVDVLASRVAQTPWSQGKFEQLEDALLGLSADIRTTVFQHTLRQLPPPEALLSMPPTLHACVVSAMIDHMGTLVEPRTAGDAWARQTAFSSFMAQLPRLPTPGRPPLRALHLTEGELRSSAAQLFDDVLAHHTQLSQLHVRLRCTGMAQRRLANCLFPKLPLGHVLRELRLHAEPNWALQDECLAPLATALPHMSSLDRLELWPLAWPSSLMEKWEEDWLPCARAASQRCNRLMAAVAAHPALAHLKLLVTDAFIPCMWPDAFPRLKSFELAVSVSRNRGLHMTDAGFAQLGHDETRMHATFPALTRLHFSLSRTFPGIPSCAERWVPLGRTSQACDSLQELRLEVHSDGGYERDAPEVAALVWPLMEGTVAACPNLERLELIGDGAEASSPAALALTPTLLRLTRLELVDYLLLRPSAAGTAFLDALAPLTCLREFALGDHTTPEGHFMARLLHTLGAAPHLTALQLSWKDRFTEEGGRAHVEGGVFREGLRKLSRLRRLTLAGPVVISDTEGLCAGIAAVPRLTELYLGRMYFEPLAERDRSITTIVSAVPEMRSLAHLTLAGRTSPVLAPELLKALRDSRLTQLQSLTIDDPELPLSACEALHDACAEHGMPVHLSVIKGT